MSRRAPRLVLALALLALLVIALGAHLERDGAHQRTRAAVATITDGDTLRLRGDERVRLLQIDAPEAGEECYAERATAELARLAPRGSLIALEPDSALDARDRYGRLLRYVLRGPTNVNVELVRRGAATPYFYEGERGRYSNRLLAAVAEARQARRGMWRACRVTWSPEAPVTTRPR